MSRTDTTIEVCYDFFIKNVDATYDVRKALFVVTNLLTPGYILLSLAAVASRSNNILKELASHGKTAKNDSCSNSTETTKGTTERNKLTPSSLSWPSWCWISKRCFAHFYFVGLLSTVIATICHLDSYHEKIRHHRIDSGRLDELMLSRTVAIVLLVIHLVRRAYECLYIQKYRDESSKMHIAGYALGVGHYMVLPLIFCDIYAINSNDIVGGNSDIKHKIKPFDFGSTNSSTRMAAMMATFILGISGLNIWLQYEQHMHHIILANMRRFSLTEKKQEEETKDAYKSNLELNHHYPLPPHRRWFRYVLSPHYLAEILLYLSFAIILEIAAAAAVQNNSMWNNRRYRHWMLFVWVAINLTVSAMNSYDWYNSRYNRDVRTNNNPIAGIASRRQTENHDKRRAIFPKIL